ncbi:MAG TPA: NDMA-dependent alcohol dehydrogenase [Acidimicrobiales bacterium]
MQTDAAVLWEPGTDWKIERIELDPPRQGEVLVRLAASGMCHSEEHIVTGDTPMPLPMVGGHEGAGVVEAVGPGVRDLAPGDHVVTSFLPACGRCPSCSAGHQNLCDLGAFIADGWQISDGTARHHLGDQDLRAMCMVGTFAHWTVGNEASFIKIDPYIPLDLAALLGCGFTTGWGSAVHRAQVQPGEDVAIVGIGGLGSAAVQGARLAGARRIFAVEPQTEKWEAARRFGATHTVASIEEAFPLIQQETQGRMCHKLVATMGVGRGDLVAPLMSLVAKRGRAVMTNVHSAFEVDVKLSMIDLVFMEKEILGCLYGSANPRVDIPLLSQLYQAGQLDLEGMVTRRYPLDGINEGYEDMRAGRNIRGVLVYPS